MLDEAYVVVTLFLFAQTFQCVVLWQIWKALGAGDDRDE